MELRKGDSYIVAHRDSKNGVKEDLNFSRRYFSSRKAKELLFPISDLTEVFGGDTHKDDDEVYTKIEIKEGESLQEILDLVISAYDSAEYDYLCEKIPEMIEDANELAERLGMPEESFFYTDSIHVKPEDEGEETLEDE